MMKRAITKKNETQESNYGKFREIPQNIYNYKLMKKQLISNITIGAVLLFLSFSSCLRPTEENICHEVSLMTATLNAGTLLLSDYTSGSVEYIQIESRNECLLGNNIRLYSNDSVIIAITNEQIFLFNRNNGNFIKEIGKYGKSPQEYRKNIYAYPYDEHRNTFFSKGWEPNSFYEYNSMGQLINKIIPPLNNYSVTSLIPVNDTLYIGFIWNYNGKQDIKLISLNSNNKVIEKYPQPLHFEFDRHKNQIDIFHWDGWFYRYNNAINVYEFLSDTIFYFNEQDNLTPRYVLKNRQLGAPYTVRFNKNFNAKDYYFVNTIFESDNSLFITYRFQGEMFLGIYNKENETTLASTEPDGFINDVDNIFPFRFYSKNKQNEIIGYQHAYEVIDWFSKHPEESANLPPNLQKFKNIKETDNPIVMIAKLKD